MAEPIGFRFEHKCFVLGRKTILSWSKKAKFDREKLFFGPVNNHLDKTKFFFSWFKSIFDPIEGQGMMPLFLKVQNRK